MEPLRAVSKRRTGLLEFHRRFAIDNVVKMFLAFPSLVWETIVNPLYCCCQAGWDLKIIHFDITAAATTSEISSRTKTQICSPVYDVHSRSSLIVRNLVGVGRSKFLKAIITRTTGSALVRETAFSQWFPFNYSRLV